MPRRAGCTEMRQTRFKPRRRLLTIAHSYAVGVNRRLADEIARADGWDVTAVAPSRFRGDFGWHQYEPLDNERCAVAPVDVHFSRRVHVMLYGRRLRELLRQPWDLVHCWEEPYVAAAAQVAAQTPARVPLVFATFQNISKSYPPPFNWIERYALDRADGVIAFGRTVYDVVTKRGFAPARARIIPPGVDTGLFCPDPAVRAATRTSAGWTDDVPVVGFVGRFVPQKGLDILLDTLGRLRSPWRALLIGSGPMEGKLREWAARYGDRVRIETTVGHTEVPRWLNAMDVLCAPSQTTPQWREQFGRMLIEAFACGVPVMASDSGEIPHVVGNAGILIPESDREAWQRELDSLLADAPRRRDLSARGRQRAIATFDWPLVARQHLAFFEQLIDGRLKLERRE
jgi:glycosyltransferase involved in cell wall biosynthesis